MAYLEEHRRRSAPKPAASPLTAAARPPAAAWVGGLLPAGLAALGLGAWEVGVRAGLVSRLLFPPPSAIALTVAEMAADGSLAHHSLATLMRLGAGVLLGGLAGLALGLLMGWQPAVRRLLDPFVAALHPLPKIALFPLILVFFGLGETSKIVITSLAAFFPVLINTRAGVRHIPPLYFEVARNYGASRLTLARRVLLPGSLPYLLAGLLLAFNLTLVVTIAVEMMSANSGLGWLVWRAWQTMRTEEVYASLAVIVALGLGANLGYRVLVRRLIPWQAERPDQD